MAVDDERLGCGRLVDEVWENIDLPPDAHEADCPDCRAARERLGVLAGATRDLAERDRDDPTMAPTSRVKANIMDVARAEVRRGKLLPLRQDANHHGDQTLRISEQAIAAMVRAGADQVPGVQARRCRVSLIGADESTETAPPSSPGPVGPWHPAEVRVWLSVSVSAGVSIPTAIGTVRSRVVARINEEVGVAVPRIDVVVEDVHDA